MSIAKHELKIEKQYFEAVLKRHKTFEIRKNDRNFKEGDIVVLHEIDKNMKFTNRKLSILITYLTNYAQKEDYVVFSFVF